MLVNVGCFYLPFVVKIPVWHNGGTETLVRGTPDSVEGDTFGEGTKLF